MDRTELEQILKKAEELRIGVVGDFCLDAYFVMDARASELSVETGLPTRPVRAQRYSLGGAGNVTANLRAMGTGFVAAYGVIGRDPFGKEMLSLFQEKGIDGSSLLVQENDWDTHVYVKPLENNREQSRIDFGNYNTLHAETAQRLLSALEHDLDSLDAVIINEQVLRGIHTPEFRQALSTLIQRHLGQLFLVDSRHYSDVYTGSIRRINLKEGARLLGGDGDPLDSLSSEKVRVIAHRLFERWRTPLFLSRGEYGCAFFDTHGFDEVPGLLMIGPTDPVGAGDSLLSGIAVALAAGASQCAAAELGTFVAGVTVQKLFQTGTASPAEILELGSDPNYRYRPDLARNPARAIMHDSTNIEVVTALHRGARFTHAIFDQDGTLSTLRQGWEEIMEPMMVKAILGSRARDVDDASYEQVVESVRSFIDRTTGIQTLAQMKGLVDLVRHFGYVPSEEILDEFGYKELYNRELLEMVNARVRQLADGGLDVEDFTVKKALPLLKALHERGVLLFLASGTDQDDVRREAEVLGYASLFGERIYGSVGDVTRDAKRIVLERIHAEIGSEAARHILTFGDGPVEIRETHKRGGFTIGVASNEIRRYGLNLAKRRRLIEAGADLIIPDYSQLDRLLAVLFAD